MHGYAVSAYLCIFYQGKSTCQAAPPGTAGAVPKEQCEQTCGKRAARGTCYACVMPTQGCTEQPCDLPGTYPSKPCSASANATREGGSKKETKWIADLFDCNIRADSSACDKILGTGQDSLCGAGETKACEAHEAGQ